MQFLSFRSSLSFVLAMLTLSVSHAAVPPAVPPRAQPFPLTQVRLLDGEFRRAMELDGKYLLSLDPDRLLHTFRLTAGLPTSAQPLDGWEKPNCGLRGHFTGHYLSACALMFESTGDPRFRERAERVVAGLAECQQALGTGYLSAFPATAFDTLETKYGGAWAPYYTMHKIMAGLLDAHRAWGNAQALEMARKMADYFNGRMAKLPPEQIEKMLHTNRHAPQNEFGGMSEVLHNLYGLTGRPEDLKLANLFDRSWIVEPLASGTDMLQGLHANTHIPQAIGWWSHYRMTGETRYRDAALFFWQQVARHRSFVTGDNSRAEHFFPLGQEAAQLSPDTAESCNVYNILKLTRDLFADAPNAEYADFYERALFNHILGSIDPDDGMTMYFLSLKPGHFKVYGTPLDSFWCCTGTGLENHAKYADSIYFHGADALWVNLFIASELRWQEKGLVLRQETKFPAEQGTALVFKLEQPAEFALNLRIPEWAVNGVKLKVNGKPQEVAGRPQSYLALRREWKDGDRLELSLPMSLRVHRALDDSATVALLYGPIVLAGELGREGFPATDHDKNHGLSKIPTPPVPALVEVDLAHPSAWLKPVPGKPLTFTTVKTARPAEVTLSPLYALHHQRYTVYWKTMSASQWTAQQQELRKTQAPIQPAPASPAGQTASAAGSQLSWPEEKLDLWHGFTRHTFKVDGCTAWVVEPRQPAPGNPWTWCMEFPDAFTERTGVPRLLAKGFFHLHIQVGNTFGCPAALKHFDAFYRAITAKGFAKKGTLIGLSRGGLYAYNWAVRNPDKVVCIYGDAPVGDFKSWPGGKGAVKGSPSDWRALIKCYEFKDEAEALAWKGNPVDTLAPLARARIPLIHVVGDIDDVVPVKENTAIIEQRYRELGGAIKVIHKPGVNHHPHGLDEPQPVVDFILQSQAKEQAQAAK